MRLKLGKYFLNVNPVPIEDHGPRVPPPPVTAAPRGRHQSFQALSKKTPTGNDEEVLISVEMMRREALSAPPSRLSAVLQTPSSSRRSHVRSAPRHAAYATRHL